MRHVIINLLDNDGCYVTRVCYWTVEWKVCMAQMTEKRWKFCNRLLFYLLNTSLLIYLKVYKRMFEMYIFYNMNFYNHYKNVDKFEKHLFFLFRFLLNVTN